MLNRLYSLTSPIGALVFACSSSFYYIQFSQSTFLYAGLSLVGQFVILYILASKFQKKVWGDWWRGGLIGSNAALNAILIVWLFGQWWLGLMAGILVLLSASLRVSRNPWYHPFLAWINWVLPMSMAVNVPGLLIFVINLLFAPMAFIHPLFRALGVRTVFDPYTSTFVMYGGLIRPIKGFAGLNMGNFIFINPGWEHLLRHEVGHLFSLAAMGSVFHYVGGIDESFVQKHYWEAFAEYLAESYNEPGSGNLSMWR